MGTEQLVLALILGVLIAAVLVLFFLSLPAQRSQMPGNSAADRQPSDAVYRDDERYWLGGVIYNNPDDPDLIVPKRFGYGRAVKSGDLWGKCS